MSEKPTILVVEDDPIVRDVTLRQLKLLGYEGIAVESGEQALQHHDANVHLILMDIGLPGIDGAHTTLMIRERELKESRKRTPIVALTAHSDRQQCVHVGMDDFIQKPALLSDIKRALDKWLPPELAVRPS